MRFEVCQEATRYSAALRDDKTLAELAPRLDVHAHQIAQLKSQLQEQVATMFDSPAPEAVGTLKTLHAKLGEHAMEIGFLECGLNSSTRERVSFSE